MEGEQGGAGVWTAGLDRARTRDSREREGRVLLTDVTAGSGSGARQAGPRPAHLSLPFWMEAWPRLALSRSGEFLLRFVLVERTLFCGKEGKSYITENQSESQIQLPSPLSTMSNGGSVAGRKDVALTPGAGFSTVSTSGPGGKVR